MNAVPSRLPAFARVPSPPPPRLNPFAAAVRTTLYDQIDHSIGADAADKLIADFGGRRLYIPMAPAPGDLITRSIGLSAAMAMAHVFGGDRILIPATSSHARRRARILAMRADRLSISHIAHELRCSERYVYKVLALQRAPEPLSYDCAPSLKGRGRGSGCAKLTDTPAAKSVPTSAPIAERLKRGPINQRS